MVSRAGVRLQISIRPALFTSLSRMAATAGTSNVAAFVSELAESAAADYRLRTLPPVPGTAPELHPGTRRYGQHRLSPGQVNTIRKLLNERAGYSQSGLAKRFSVHQSTINRELRTNAS